MMHHTMVVCSLDLAVQQQASKTPARHKVGLEGEEWEVLGGRGGEGK